MGVCYDEEELTYREIDYKDEWLFRALYDEGFRDESY